MTATLERLKSLAGTRLPGGELVIEPRENAILEHAVRAPDSDPELAHPIWFVVISLRCLGVSVDELCEMAGKTAQDTLLFGQCVVDQREPLVVGARYRADAKITTTGSRTTRDGSRLDNLDVRTDIATEDGKVAGSVTATYLFKRGAGR